MSQHQINQVWWVLALEYRCGLSSDAWGQSNRHFHSFGLVDSRKRKHPGFLNVNQYSLTCNYHLSGWTITDWSQFLCSNIELKKTTWAALCIPEGEWMNPEILRYKNNQNSFVLDFCCHTTRYLLLYYPNLLLFILFHLVRDHDGKLWASCITFRDRWMHLRN